MTNQENEQSDSLDSQGILNSSKSNSEHFSILAKELIEVKALVMTLIDLQKSALFATGVSETELETNVQTLIDGYRQRFLSNLTSQIKEAS